MSEIKEDWESERVFGHYILVTKEHRRCQIKAKIQCVLQKYMTKDKALKVAEEITKELGL